MVPDPTRQNYSCPRSCSWPYFEVESRHHVKVEFRLRHRSCLREGKVGLLHNVWSCSAKISELPKHTKVSLSWVFLPPVDGILGIVDTERPQRREFLESSLAPTDNSQGSSTASCLHHSLFGIGNHCQWSDR